MPVHHWAARKLGLFPVQPVIMTWSDAPVQLLGLILVHEGSIIIQ